MAMPCPKRLVQSLTLGAAERCERAAFHEQRSNIGTHRSLALESGLHLNRGAGRLRAESGGHAGRCASLDPQLRFSTSLLFD